MEFTIQNRIVQKIQQDGFCPELTAEQLNKIVHPDPNINCFTAKYEVVLDHSTGAKCTKTIEAFYNINTGNVIYTISV